VSLADIHLLGINVILESLVPTYLENYPEIKALIERISNVENIKKYLATQ